MEHLVPCFSPERFLMERVAARYGLSFIVHDSVGTVEERNCGVWESRDATGPELDMWRIIVPEDLRVLVARAWRGEAVSLPATPEEVYSSVLYREYVYMAAEDFVLLRGLPCFRPSTDLVSLRDGVMGAVHGRWRACVSRLVPQGSFHSSDRVVPVLRPLRPSGDVRPVPPGPEDLLGVDLEPLKVVGRYDLRTMGVPGDKTA